ncbi:unnamed protein product [Moneuplotes crassus]|uniref:XPG-I domain-containing protein n=1 Tax=Euplotes crassus TaxID=5936 RepID=A0AAD1URG9_EUPCR|nr:unnamed protein product [Moneuplotes crassus]
MGVHKLMNLINEKAEKAVTDIYLSSFVSEMKDKMNPPPAKAGEDHKEAHNPEISPNVVIDGVVFLYSTILRVYKQKMKIFSKAEIEEVEEAEEVKEEYKKLIQHDILNRLIEFIENGLSIVFVFDVSSSFSTNDLVMIKKAGCTFDRLKMAEVIPQDLYNDTKKIISILGGEVVEVNGNIHYECSKLSKKYKSLAVVSEDLAFLIFETPAIIRYIDAEKGFIRLIQTEEMLKSFNINQEQFSDLCILLGCDYSKTFELLHTAKALDYVQKYKDIEYIISHFESEYKDVGDMKMLKYLDEYEYLDARKKINAIDAEDFKFAIKKTTFPQFEQPDLEVAFDLIVGNKEDGFKYFAPQNSNYTEKLLNRLKEDGAKLIQKKLQFLAL